MTPLILCVLQMRLASTRLPNKMLLDLGDETLAARGWRIACEAFGPANCVVAIPASDEAGPLGDELRRIGARIFAWDGVERDVLGRFHACAHLYRWHPDSVIFRMTPDDPFKDPMAMRRVAAGERLPVEIGGEAFTLAMLDEAHSRTAPIFIGALCGVSITANGIGREHLTHTLFPVAPPKPSDDQVWTIDTQADYERAKAWVEGEK